MSLRFRINLIITVLMALFALIMGRIVIDDTRRSVREEMEAGTKVTLQLLSGILYSSQFVPQSGERNGVLLVFLHNLGRVRAHDIRMYDDAGALIYASPASVYKAGRSAPQWFSRLVAPRQPSTQLVTPHGRLLVTPDSSRSVLDAWDDVKYFIGLMLGFFVLLNMAVFFLLGRALRPVKTILQGLSEMEQGRLETRLPGFSLPEFDAIGHTFNRMADALEQSHAENRQLALVARQSSDAIVIHDLAGNISFWNPAAERLFGWRSEEIVGKSATLLTPADLEGETADNLHAIRARRVVENLETRRLARDGRIVDVALSAAPLIDPFRDQVIGEINSLRDITEHKRAQEAQRELKQNRRLTQLIQTRLEEERRAIARELHDELGQCVTAIKTIGTAIAHRTEGSSPEVHANAQTIVNVASHIYDVVHGIIRQLRPSALDNLGLREALEDVIRTWRERHPEVHCDLRLGDDLANLGETINITIYRVVQECLTNVARHSLATQVDIAVSRAADRVLVTVADNGRGLGEGREAEAARFGIMGMRERVEALAGVFSVHSQPGAGMRVSAGIPLAPIDEELSTHG